jgi:hypothetical protein
MEDIQLQQLWKQLDEQVAFAKNIHSQSMHLNQQWFEQLQLQKAAKKLNQLKNIKWLAVVLGVLWVMLLGFFIAIAFQLKNFIFISAVAPIAVITAIAIIVYVYHIVLIHAIDQSDSIVATQEKLLQLQASTLQITRILFLQLPFYCYWFVTPQMIESSPLAFWGIVVPITVAFAGLALWLFFNIKLANANKKWFRFLFGSAEWTAIQKAKVFMEEVETFKAEIKLN